MLRSSLPSNYPGYDRNINNTCLGNTHWMCKWSLKFVFQYLIMIATLEEMIATYTDHIKIMSYRGLKSMYHAGNFKTLFLYVT